MKKKEISQDAFLPVEVAHETGMPTVQEETDIETMFDTLLAKLKSGGFREFIESMYNQFQETGSLSKKQEAALEKAYFNSLRPYSRRQKW